MRGVLLGGEHASDAAGDLLQVQVPQAAIGYQNPIGKRVVHLEIGHSDWEKNKCGCPRRTCRICLPSKFEEK